MNKEFKITKEKVLAMAEECEEAKAVLKKGFPEAFEDKWVNITKEIRWKVDDGTLHGYYEDMLLLTASSLRFGISPMSPEDGSGRFRIEHDADSHKVFKRNK